MIFGGQKNELVCKGVGKCNEHFSRWPYLPEELHEMAENERARFSTINVRNRKITSNEQANVNSNQMSS
jgi:hypothetical protein